MIRSPNRVLRCAALILGLGACNGGPISDFPHGDLGGDLPTGAGDREPLDDKDGVASDDGNAEGVGAPCASDSDGGVIDPDNGGLEETDAGPSPKALSDGGDTAAADCVRR